MVYLILVTITRKLLGGQMVKISNDSSSRNSGSCRDETGTLSMFIRQKQKKINTN